MSSQAANTSGMGARHPVIAGAETAWDMLHEEETSKHITTSCEDLDTILGGGIHCKQVTEIGGVPGIGKTQLGIQLAVNVQIPVRFGGLGGKAIYIDTEGSFMAERAFQIAEACVNETLYGGVVHGKDCQVHANAFLSNIFYSRVCSYTEQIAVVNHLDKFIGDQDNVKIVIMDSVTFHFRQGFEDLALRTRILGGLSLKLMKLAKEHNLAVVLLNQVTFKFTNGSFQLTLALGESWLHSCTTRLILYWKGNDRFAFLDKSSSLPAASASYFISSKGIRNAPSPCKRIKVF